MRFTMDDADLRAAYGAVKGDALSKGGDKLTRRMVIDLADYAGETPRGLVLRLERLQLIKPGSWDWFVANGGITPEQIRQVRSERLTEPRP